MHVIDEALTFAFSMPLLFRVADSLARLDLRWSRQLKHKDKFRKFKNKSKAAPAAKLQVKNYR
jgi:hypothetical protein